MKSMALASLIVLVVVATVASIIVGNGNVLVAVAPVVIFGVLYAAWKTPLRWSLLTTTFLALTLENPSDLPACGQWKSPFYDVGAVMLVHLNVTLPYKPLVFSGLDVVLAYLFVVAALRREKFGGGERDVESASPMAWFAGLSLAAAAWMWIYGMARGNADVPNSLWQLQRVAYLPALVF